MSEDAVFLWNWGGKGVSFKGGNEIQNIRANPPIEIKAFKEIKNHTICQTLTIWYARAEN